MGAGFRCSECGEWHESLALSYEAERPDEGERAGTELRRDECVIGGRWFFLRGRIEIPVVDGPGRFFWGVWVLVSSENFQRASQVIGDELPGGNELLIGGLVSTRLPSYPDTMNLKAMIYRGSLGQPARVELEEADHPLVAEQRDGITMWRVQQIAEALLHPPMDRRATTCKWQLWCKRHANVTAKFLQGN